jgi:hypothetical protein
VELLDAAVASREPGRFNVVAYGVDDITLGFDMAGSKSIALLNRAAGVQSRRGKMLGERASWGAWSHLLGRSAAFWKSDTKRLYVQAKLGKNGTLCPPKHVSVEARRLMERMASIGIVSYEPAWTTRIDVAVDGRCEPADGKLLLDALESVRLPNGWRTRSVGVPRSTVYFSARASDSVYARAYCRNLKLKTGEAFALIRLEAEHRFAPMECSLERASDPELIARLWLLRYGGLSASVKRIEREVQTLKIFEKVVAGELTPQQGERVGMFLDLERLGLVKSYYPPPLYSSRRRELFELGIASNEVGQTSLDIDLEELIEPYRAVVENAA